MYKRDRPDSLTALTAIGVTVAAALSLLEAHGRRQISFEAHGRMQPVESTVPLSESESSIGSAQPFTLRSGHAMLHSDVRHRSHSRAARPPRIRKARAGPCRIRRAARHALLGARLGGLPCALVSAPVLFLRWWPSRRRERA